MSSFISASLKFLLSFVLLNALTGSDYPMLRPPEPSSSTLRKGFISNDALQDEPEQYPSTSFGSEEFQTPATPSHTRARFNTSDSYDRDWAIEGPSDLSRGYSNVIRQIKDFDQPLHLELHEEEEDPYYDDVRRFVNPALLSHLAVQLRDSVTRGTHVKGSIPYPRAFTGKDIVVCNIRGRLSSLINSMTS